MTILHIDSSIQGEKSISRQLTAAMVSTLAAQGRGPVIYRDLASDAPQAPDAPGACVAQFLACDVVVIGAPMYNLGIPSRLKSWIDAIAVPRKTFFYAPDGHPQGLAGGRRVMVAYASGGFHHGPQADFVEPYLRAVFGMLGITAVDVVRAEGVDVSADHRARALAQAGQAIAEMAARIGQEPWQKTIGLSTSPVPYSRSCT